MRVVEQRESSVHTHYLTDGERLTEEAVRAIELAVGGLLVELRIVFPLRVLPERAGGRVELVLGCRPVGEEARRIRALLDELLAPLPLRPAARAQPTDGAG